MIFFLAIRNVILQRNRYLLMFTAVLIGFCMVTLIHSLTYGALETVKTKAARYFSGHISITGYKNNKPNLDDPDALMKIIDEAGLPIRTISSRTIYYRMNASIFFGGESVRQRRLIGIDFKKERNELSQLRFLDGSIENLLDGGKNGILISETAAKLLGARVGDSVMLYMTTDSGQYNTSTLYIRGIFSETSLFGYVAYIRQEDLNRLLVREPVSATDIAIYAEPGVNHESLLNELRILLMKHYNVLPYMPTKDALNEELAKTDWSNGPVLALLTLDAHLDQITSILGAVQVVTWIVLSMFMLIVMVGILNTYRVLVYERTPEIGTLRALGMQRGSVRLMFLLEAIILGVSASISGFIISIVLMNLVKIFDLSGFPGTGLFTDQGHMQPYVNPWLVLATLFMMTAAVFVAAFGPAGKASKLAPADALRNVN